MGKSKNAIYADAARARRIVSRSFQINQALWESFENHCNTHRLNPNILLIRLILKRMNRSLARRDRYGRQMTADEARLVRFNRPRQMIEPPPPMKRRRVANLYKGMVIPDGMTAAELMDLEKLLGK